MHVHSNRCRRHSGYGLQISSLKVKLSPRGNYFRAKTKTAAEPLTCRKSLVRGLSIDVEHSSKTENEVRPFLQIRQHSQHWVSPSIGVHSRFLLRSRRGE